MTRRVFGRCTAGRSSTGIRPGRRLATDPSARSSTGRPARRRIRQPRFSSARIRRLAARPSNAGTRGDGGLQRGQRAADRIGDVGHRGDALAVGRRAGGEQALDVDLGRTGDLGDHRHFGHREGAVQRVERTLQAVVDRRGRVCACGQPLLDRDQVAADLGCRGSRSSTASTDGGRARLDLGSTCGPTTSIGDRGGFDVGSSVRSPTSLQRSAASTGSAPLRRRAQPRRGV